MELIMAGRRWTVEIVNLIHFQKGRLRYIVPHEIKVRPTEQVCDVRFLARKEIVKADHVVTHFHEALAQMGAEKTCAAGD